MDNTLINELADLIKQYPEDHKFDGRSVLITEGRDAGREGILLHFHNGGGIFKHWVARIYIPEDRSHKIAGGLNYQIEQFELL